MIPLLAASGASALVRTLGHVANQLKSNSAEGTQGQESSPAADFLKIARQTPAQRLHEKIMKKLNLTDEELSKMDPQEQARIRDLIKDEIKKELEAGGQSGVGVLKDMKV